MPIPTRRAAYYGLALLTLLNFVNYIDRFILVAVLPRVKVDLRLSDFELGLLSNAFLVTYFATSPLFGRFGDLLSRTRLIAGGVAIWSGATALAGLTRTFVQLLGARALVGVGESAYASISPSLVADYFSRERRGRVFAIFYLAIPVGSAAGFLLGGLLERAVGWRAALCAVGLPGLALAGLTLTAPDPPRGAQGEDAVVPGRATLRESLHALARNRLYVWTVIGYAAYTFALGGLSVWMPTFLERVRGVDLARADLQIGAVTVAAGLLGTFLGGYFADLLAKRIAQAHLYVSGISMLMAVPLSWIALTRPSEPIYVSTLFGAELFAFLSTSPINVVIVNAVHPTIRSLAMAASIFVIHLLGDAIAAPVIGLLADATDLAHAVLIIPMAVAIAGVIWTGVAWCDPSPDRQRG